MVAERKCAATLCALLAVCVAHAVATEVHEGRATRQTDDNVLTPGVGHAVQIPPLSSLTLPIAATINAEYLNSEGGGQVPGGAEDLSDALISGYAVSVVWCNGPPGHSQVSINGSYLGSPLFLEKNIQLCLAVGTGLEVGTQCVNSRHYAPDDGSVVTVIAEHPVQKEGESVPLFEEDPEFKNQNVTVTVASGAAGATIFFYVAETRRTRQTDAPSFVRSVPGAVLKDTDVIRANLTQEEQFVNFTLTTEVPEYCSNNPGKCNIAFYITNGTTDWEVLEKMENPADNVCGVLSVHTNMQLFYSVALENSTRSLMIPCGTLEGKLAGHAFLVLGDPGSINVANSIPLASGAFDFHATQGAADPQVPTTEERATSVEDTTAETSEESTEVTARQTGDPTASAEGAVGSGGASAMPILSVVVGLSAAAVVAIGLH